MPPFILVTEASRSRAATPRAGDAADDPTRHAGVMPTAAEFVRRFRENALAVVEEGEFASLWEGDAVAASLWRDIRGAIERLLEGEDRKVSGSCGAEDRPADEEPAAAPPRAGDDAAWLRSRAGLLRGAAVSAGRRQLLAILLAEAARLDADASRCEHAAGPIGDG